MSQKLSLILISLISVFYLAPAQQTELQDFDFIFMTDIHLEPGKRAPEGFRMAIDTINEMDVDFVLTGGDLIADALGASHGRSDSLYQLYVDMMEEFEIPVYNTIGNHELYGIYHSSGADTSHPDYGHGMYERYLGDTYYSFDHKGCHFIVLNSIIDGDNRYLGMIDSAQMEWLKEDISAIDTKTPVIISSHIPFISAFDQLRKGSLNANSPGLVVGNSRDVLVLLYKYNLKLVLQGHLHIIEEISFQEKISFLVGGAVSARWWGGPMDSMEEGFMLVKIRNGEPSWEYVDYGFDVGNR